MAEFLLLVLVACGPNPSYQSALRFGLVTTYDECRREVAICSLKRHINRCVVGYRRTWAMKPEPTR